MSTSKLQRETSHFLSVFFGEYTIRENHRPDWLITENGERLELDFFIEELRLAIEVQGQQHYQYTPFFHGNHDGFKKRLAFDRIKAAKCDKAKISLIEISSEFDIPILLEPFIPVQPTELPKIVLFDLIDIAWETLQTTRQETDAQLKSQDLQSKLDAVELLIKATENVLRYAKYAKQRKRKSKIARIGSINGRRVRKCIEHLKQLYDRRARLVRKMAIEAQKQNPHSGPVADPDLPF